MPRLSRVPIPHLVRVRVSVRVRVGVRVRVDVPRPQQGYSAHASLGGWRGLTRIESIGDRLELSARLVRARVRVRARAS